MSERRTDQDYQAPPSVEVAQSRNRLDVTLSLAAVAPMGLLVVFALTNPPLLTFFMVPILGAALALMFGVFVIRLKRHGHSWAYAFLVLIPMPGLLILAHMTDDRRRKKIFTSSSNYPRFENDPFLDEPQYVIKPPQSKRQG